MTLSLRYWPDPILKTPCSPVTEFTTELRRMASEMLELMYDHEGVGLAGPQVGVSLRIFVLDVWWPDTGSRTRGMVFINPKLTLSSTTSMSKEGCLSLPGASEYVRRHQKVHVESQNEFGESCSLDAEGLFAVCLQHEMDHLNGITMVERVGPMARRMLRKQLMSTLPPKKAV